MHLLIPYIQSRHPDPLLDEFTYGDEGMRARKLKSKVHNGDYVFFHTSKGGKKVITAYFVVNRVLDTKEAAHIPEIITKYKCIHLIKYLNGRTSDRVDDVIVFGDPILSRELDVPLHFDRKLADKLSLGIEFPPGRSETQVIGSATRAWRELTNKDVNILRKAIDKEQTRHRPSTLLSTEEVAETIEWDIENYLLRHPDLIGKGLKVSERQLPIESGRIDLLFEDEKGNLVIVELKLNRIGSEAIRQITRYVHELREKEPGKKVSGVLVCSGVMPAYEQDLRKHKNIRILTYGWEMKVAEWR